MDKDYKKLIERFVDEIFNNAGDEAKVIYESQKKHMNDILSMISKVMLDYNIEDSAMSLGIKDYSKLKKEFYNYLVHVTSGEIKYETEIINNILGSATTDRYYTNGYILDLGSDFKLKMLSEKDITKIVNNTLKGELWNDRLWTNKNNLAMKLGSEIDKFLNGNTSVNAIRDVIEKRFKNGAYETERLVQTEVARCQSEANDLFAEEHGLEWQEFTATLDNATSEICRGYDGKRYKINDYNKPVPPLHPFCRSCLINIPYEDWNPTKRRDNSTGKVINYKSYEEWLSGR